jgi:hypothetical protein
MDTVLTNEQHKHGLSRLPCLVSGKARRRRHQRNAATAEQNPPPDSQITALSETLLLSSHVND